MTLMKIEDTANWKRRHSIALCREPAFQKLWTCRTRKTDNRINESTREGPVNRSFRFSQPQLFTLHTSLQFAPIIFLGLIIPVISGAEYSVKFEILAVCRIMSLLSKANNTYRGFLKHILQIRGEGGVTITVYCIRYLLYHLFSKTGL